ncbi:unnamed protein product [Parajaminaea phylloscopi]
MSSGFLSSISSMFGGSAGASTGSSSRQGNKASTFGSGFSASSSRRGPPSRLDDAWSLPYSYGNAGTDLRSPSLVSPHSAYPPPASASTSSFSSAGRYPLNGAAADSVAHLASQSSHNLVVPFGRMSLSGDARTAAGVSIPSTSFPPLRHTWNRIRAWSDNFYPELKDTLNWPATEAQIEDLEFTIGFSLPPAVRDSYLCFNGQELESNQSCNDGIFFGLPLLSLDQIAEEWRFWRAVDEDPTGGANPEVRQWQSSCPDKWVRAEYSCRGWIPLITDHVGNYIGVDLTPHPSGGGAPGQVILFGRDFDTKVVLWRGEGEGGWGRFLQYVAEELENGEMWTLEDASSSSEDEEDSIGYESYFTGGGSGASRGGGDRAGEGAAGFRLTGEYRGWPVLEAWADRSMRCWEEVGMPVGVPAGQGEMPSVHLSEVDENGEALDAEGSKPKDASPRVSLGSNAGDAVGADGPSHPLQREDDGGDSAAGAFANSREAAYARSLSPNLSAGRPFSPVSEGSNQDVAQLSNPAIRRVSDTLAPPPSSTKASRSKQKQREIVGQSPRSKIPPPSPAQPLDLPTIDDVRAMQAAALAEHERSTRVQFSDLEAPNSLGRNGTIRAGAGGASYHGGRSDAYSSDTLELENRSSGDALHSRPSGRTLNDVVVVGDSRRTLHSPTVLSPRSSSERPSFFDSPSTNLIDGSAPNSPNLADTSGSPSLLDRVSSPLSSSMSGPDYVSSPLGHSLMSGHHGSSSGHSTPTKQPPKALHGPNGQTRTNSIKGVPLAS